MGCGPLGMMPVSTPAYNKLIHTTNLTLFRLKCNKHSEKELESHATEKDEKSTYTIMLILKEKDNKQRDGGELSVFLMQLSLLFFKELRTSNFQKALL